MDLSYGIVCRRIKHKKRVLFAFLHFYDAHPAGLLFLPTPFLRPP
jgi:hypothetical protein